MDFTIKNLWNCDFSQIRDQGVGVFRTIKESSVREKGKKSKEGCSLRWGFDYLSIHKLEMNFGNPSFWNEIGELFSSILAASVLGKKMS